MNATTLSCVKGTSTLVRPKFGPGMLLQADDLDALTNYSRELNRLLFRSLFGCGVVCGLVVTADEDRCDNLRITVGAGLALGCNGDPIYVSRDQSMTIQDCEGDEIPDSMWVLLCGTSKCCAPRLASCGCDDSGTSTPTRVRDCFELRLVAKLPKCVCCQPPEKKDEHTGSGEVKVNRDRRGDCPCGPTDGCYADHYAGVCDCCDDCADGSCDCNCVVLAKLIREDDPKIPWKVEHCYRRFIRPIFMRDPECHPAVREEELIAEFDESEREALEARLERGVKPARKKTKSATSA